MKFDILGLRPDILQGIKEAGFEQCTPIQEQSLPECLAGKDVIAKSQTGSGKTAVFLLTIFERLLSSGPDAEGRPRALVMVPTRELAAQVIDDAGKLGKFLSLKHVAVYGGVEYEGQVGALKNGVDLVVATPGRMIDLYKTKRLSLDAIEIFVIDEADRMFDMGFAPDIMYIAGKLPRKKPRQTMLFSATIDENVRRLASSYMKPDPVQIEIAPEQVTVDKIDQKVVYVSNEEKLSILLTLLKRPDVERCIIFTNMKRTAEMLGWKLTANGIPAKVLTGDLSQEKRQKAIDGMKAGKLKTLVATDVAARGLHIEDITHVINYDLPDDSANYVHRIGRTARAGKSGKAYSLVCEDHVLNLPEIEKFIEKKLESEWIEDAEIVKDTAPAFRGRSHGHHEKRERKPEARQRGGRPPKQEDKRAHPQRQEPPKQEQAKKAAEAPVEGARPHKHGEKKPFKKRTRPARPEKGAGEGRSGRPERGHRGPRGASKTETNAAQRAERPAAQAAGGHARHESDRPHRTPQDIVDRIEAAPVPKAFTVEPPEKNTGDKPKGLIKRFLQFLRKK